MKLIKNKHCSRLTNFNLNEHIMILPTTNLQPGIENLASNIQPQNSHYIESMLNKKSHYSLRSFMYCICEVFCKNCVVAPHALQQTKSGSKSKKVGNHRCIPMK